MKHSRKEKLAKVNSSRCAITRVAHYRRERNYRIIVRCLQKWSPLLYERYCSRFQTEIVLIIGRSSKESRLPVNPQHEIPRGWVTFDKAVVLKERIISCNIIKRILKVHGNCAYNKANVCALCVSMYGRAYVRVCV